MEITLVRIESTTDGKYVGLIMPLPSVGSVIEHDGTRFHCQGIVELTEGLYKAWNTNYVVLARYSHTIVVG